MKYHRLSSLIITSIFFSFMFPSSFLYAEEASKTLTKETPAEIETLVRNFFADDPVMISIAHCESNFRQFTDAGNVLRAAGRYTGVFQIDEIIHTPKATSLGFDILTAQGNIEYASYLYTQQGTQPWKNCAKKYTPTTQAISKTPSVTTSQVSNVLGSGACPADLIISQKIKKGDRDGQMSTYAQSRVTQVSLLQKHINRILASEYNEAAGPIDGIFGSLTKQGVERLQRALNDNLELDKPLIIDGIVGPFTMGAINMSCGTPQS